MGLQYLFGGVVAAYGGAASAADLANTGEAVEGDGEVAIFVDVVVEVEAPNQVARGVDGVARDADP